MPEEKKSIPGFPAKTYALIREKFRKSLPRNVDSAYVSSTLGVTEKTSSVYIPWLRALGLIDDEGKPTQLANKWRMDEHYKDACKEIINNHLPKSLTGAHPPENPDVNAVSSWFSLSTGVGAEAAKRMANFYLLLSEGDPKKLEPGKAKTLSSKTHPPRRKPFPVKKAERQTLGGANLENKNSEGSFSSQVNIKFDINISPEASPEQIDAIFASMAKHFGNK